LVAACHAAFSCGNPFFCQDEQDLKDSNPAIRGRGHPVNPVKTFAIFAPLHERIAHFRKDFPHCRSLFLSFVSVQNRSVKSVKSVVQSFRLRLPALCPLAASPLLVAALPLWEIRGSSPLRPVMRAQIARPAGFPNHQRVDPLRRFRHKAGFRLKRTKNAALSSKNRKPKAGR
jgi:hypothetical protein